MPYEVMLHYGWNCGSYPASPYDSAMVCEFSALHLSFKKAETSFYTSGKWYETPYTLCDTVTLSAEFSSTELGYVYPDTVVLQNLDPGLQILGVSITGTGAAVPLTPIVQPQVWLIGAGTMMAAGFPGGGFNNGETFTLKIEFIPSCTFAGDTTLPDIVIFANNFCNDLLSANENKTMNSTFRMSTVQSNCTDCWSITKTADADTATAVADTVTYTITVCNNSANAQTGAISDIMQGGFVVTATTLPGSVTLGPMQCDTFTVSGYFAQYGSCFYNVATVTSPANTTWQDSVCVEVVSPCANTDTTFADSTTFAGTATLGAMSIYVAGQYFVSGTLTLNNCMVYVGAGGQITVQGGGNLILNNTTIQSCDTMWRGVTVLANGKTTLNGSTLRDANNAIYAVHQSQVEILQSKIYDCVTGLLIPAQTGNGYNSISLKVDGSSFKMQSQNFRPDYAGQPAHGSIPKAGIDITNMITTIGLTNLNEFEKLNTGIVAKSSIITVKRSKFTNIGYDTFYNEPYRGTALVSVGMPTGDIHTGSLTVLPEAIAYNTVDNCYRGIYTDKSVLNVNYVHLLNVRTGVESKNSSLLSTNMVTNCTITATHCGIFWNYNPLARFMYANDNNITVNGSLQNGGFFSVVNSGIYMSEFSNGFVQYTASGNTIHTNNAGFGIYAGVLTNAKIKYNNINMTNNGTGISVNKNISANISCNEIKGDYSTGITGNSSGISAGNMNKKVTIYCNTVDSTYRGFNFGGANPNTVFRGNEMNTHYVGLYLNTGSPTNPTYIGTQPHHGNEWFGPFTSGFGGINLTQSQFVPASRFDVDSTLGPVYNPVVTPSSWFNPTNGGNTYHCSNSTVCTSPPPAMADTTIRDLIESGIFDSEEISDEAKAIAREYIYNELAKDSALWIEDSTYIQFMNENQGDPVAYLYDVEQYLKAAYTYDSTLMAIADSAYNQINILTDSIACINEGTCEGDIEVLTNQINFLNQTIQNINIQRESIIADNLTNASYVNDLVVDGELPEINTTTINNIEIDYIETGQDKQVLIDNYNGLLAIANQCPFVGGSAVERARSMIAIINDSIIYNDDYTCLQSGIYRMANDTTEKINYSEIKIIPNPANDKVTIELSGINDGICKVQIRNVLNEIVYESEFSCSEKNHLINISDLSMGIYSITVNAANKKSLINKLIIVR